MWGRGTVLGGRYTLAERIGGGAMGEVWRAEDRVLERSVAAKILLPKLLDDPQFAARFRREAKVLASLSHPGIVDVHDYGEQDGAETGDERLAYIVMELVDGRPLDEVREDEGPMSVRRAFGIVAEALDALHAAHRRGIVHRDIKPSNLMLRDDGRVTVTDFGIAHSKAASRLTASHAVLGTALYIAPEQAEGIATVPASDLYSLGVLTYELLTGETPFTGETVLEVVLKHIREPAPELPAAFPEPVRAFVARALAKLPEDRYADAAVMAAAARRAVREAAGRTAQRQGATAVAPPAVPLVGPAVPPPTASPVGPAVPPRTAPPSAPPVVPHAPGASGPEPILVVSGPAATAAAPARPPWWKRRRPVIVILPVVLTATTVTVLNLAPWSKDAAQGAPPAASAGATPGGQAPVATPPAGAATPGTTPSAAASGGATPSGKQTGDPAAQGAAAAGGGAAGGTPAGKGAGAGGVGAGGAAAGKGDSESGGAAKAGAAGSGNDANGNDANGNGGGGQGKPKPPPPAADKPATCGGDNWGAITNVGSGRRMGLAGDSPSGTGGQVVSGGNSRFGWVQGGSQFPEFHACNLSGSALGLKSAPAYNEKTGLVLAPSTGYSGYVTGWKTTPAAGGAHQINYYVGDGCVTDNGPGVQLTVDACTPGNKAQLWRLP